jgi:hypothetical protein
MATVEELLGEVVAAAQDQARWVRAAALPQVREIIDQTLTTTQMRRGYELCDGSRTGKQVGSEIGTPQQTVSNWTRRWRDLGIAYEAGKGVKHIAALKPLGLPLEVDG